LYLCSQDDVSGDSYYPQTLRTKLRCGSKTVEEGEEMKQTSIVTLVIVVLLALMVGSVGAVCDSRVLVPFSAEWKAACYSQEPIVVKEPSLIEEILDFFSKDANPVSYKVSDMPIQREFTITKLVFDEVKKEPVVVTEIKKPAYYTATLMKKTILVNKTELKATGKFSGFIKGVVTI